MPGFRLWARRAGAGGSRVALGNGNQKMNTHQRHLRTNADAGNDVSAGNIATEALARARRAGMRPVGPFGECWETMQVHAVNNRSPSTAEL